MVKIGHGLRYLQRYLLVHEGTWHLFMAHPIYLYIRTTVNIQCIYTCIYIYIHAYICYSIHCNIYIYTVKCMPKLRDYVYSLISQVICVFPDSLMEYVYLLEKPRQIHIP